MNYKQKLGYTTLGAAIMLIGMWLSPLISPPVTAQHNGVFDKIQCTSLTVVDKQGQTAVKLVSDEEFGNRVTVFNEQGTPAVTLVSREEFNEVTVFNQQRNPAVGLTSDEELGNGVTIYNEQGNPAVDLASNEELGNRVDVYDKQGIRLRSVR